MLAIVPAPHPERSAGDEDQHQRRGAGHEEPDGEGAHTDEERHGRTAAVGLLPRGDEGDELGQHVRAEGGAVEGVAVEVGGHRRHRRDDGHRLERVHGDRHHEGDGKGALPYVPERRP